MEQSSRYRDNRSRSRSPYRSRNDDERSHHRHRSHRDIDAKHRRETKSSSIPKALPYNARELTKRDYEVFRPMFALYLDIQKHLVLEDLEASEAKGRWKSFINRWNRGELAEGWYDPTTFKKSIDSANDPPPRRSPPPPQRRMSPDYNPRQTAAGIDSDDEYGPAPALSGNDRGRSGPAIPTMQDLELNRELANEDVLDARDGIRRERKAQRNLEKERMDELVPKAEAGTRERQLEKRKEVASSNKAFAAAKEGGDIADVNESDLMGGEEGLDSYKKQKQETERRKNEREIRKDEIMRARKEEREERAREFRDREKKTMKGLIELAKARFG